MNKTINKGISRRGFLTSAAAAATLSAVVGCNDEREVTHFQTGTEEQPMLDAINFVNKEDILYRVLVNRYKDRVCVLPEPAANIESRLHFYESNDSPTGPQNLVDKYDAFVLCSRAGIAGGPANTHILRYIGHNPAQKVVMFKDYGTGDVEATYDNNNSGVVVRGGVGYSFKVDPSTNKLTVDMTGDALFNGKQALIVDKDDRITLEEDLLLK